MTFTSLQSHLTGIEIRLVQDSSAPCDAFNRTLLELKSKELLRQNEVLKTFNRTLLELGPSVKK